MNDRLRIILGLACLSLVVGSGILMTVFTLRQQTATVSTAEWQELQATVAALVARQGEPTPDRSSPAEPSSRADPVLPPPTEKERIPINTASQFQLEELTGIGPVRAAAILEARTNGGPFHDLDDLRARVPKIPRSVVEEISQEIVFEE